MSARLHAQKVKKASVLCQILRREREPLDARTASQAFHNLGHIGKGDASIEEMIRLHKDGDAGRALVEAARSANARLDLRESAGLHLLL